MTQGLAGALDRADVRPLIEHQIGDVDVQIYAFAPFFPGRQATEPEL